MDTINPHQIAVEAMRYRGLLPAFAPQALQEAEAARQASLERIGSIRDLDQLSLAGSLAGQLRQWRQTRVALHLNTACARPGV